MKKILPLIITMLLISCKSESQELIDYGNIINDCLTQKEIKLLNKGCALFEKELLNCYDENNLIESYKAFLEGVQSINFPPEMFNKNSETTDFLNNLKEQDLFSEIWEKYDDNSMSVDDEIVVIEIETNIIRNEEPEMDFFKIKSDGKYLNCLIKNCHSLKLKEILESVKEFPDLSPGVFAEALINEIDNNKLNSEGLRLIVAINFYYEFKLHLSD